MPLTKPEAIGSLFGGIMGLSGSILWLVKTERFRETASRANGKVVELVESSWSASDGGPTYAPRFEYTTPDGELWSVSGVATYPAAFGVGDRVRVLYLPDNPAHARIDSATQLWLLPIILGMAGTVAIVVGLVFLFDA